MTTKKLVIYNSIKKKKEVFEPLNPPFVGLYVCGPTVYGDPHLGHARPAITYDVLFRYLKYLDYKVRYIRNITDVGHLERDSDDGEDKILKKATLEQLEPMEVVQHYTNSYKEQMRKFNTLPPSIEPQASGHIIEQQRMISQILKNGYAYEKNGSVYFDVEKYNQKYNYGKLSGRKIEELLSNTRTLEGQEEKKNSFDFALWKKAEPKHIMRWPSEWGDGFPGWHLECSTMSTKYLGAEFDIHGGGMDLLFPHHECEIAQSTAANGKESVRYWMHNNMITIEGQKMGKSLGNFITLEEMFSGTHEKLEKAYSPMTIRFFMLQAHYRSTLDFSNEALQASEKGLERLFNAFELIDKLPVSKESSYDIERLKSDVFDALNDDLNTPIMLSHLFDAAKYINSVKAGSESITAEDAATLKQLFSDLLFDICGLKQEESSQNQGNSKLNEVMDILLNLRIDAKANKDYATADKIRDELQNAGFIIKDKKDGFEWELK
jgi:cysteinyl-tRNA synthetase